MGGAPVIESEGRGFPIDTRPSRPRRREEDRGRDGGRDPPRPGRERGQPARLPARRRRDRADRRAARSACPPTSICTASTAASIPRAQRAAIAAAPPGRRKLVLATSIAETSLTLDGVRIVVDSRPRAAAALRPRRRDDPAGHRARQPGGGRAARGPRRAAGAGPGLSALGGSGDRRACRASTRPKSSRRTSRALLLDCAIWGVADPARAALARSAAGRRGRRGAQAPARARRARRRRAARPRMAEAIADLPLPPRLAHMLIEAGARGWGATAAEVAVLLSERGLGGQRCGSGAEAAPLARERGQRAEAAARAGGRRWLRSWSAAAGRRAQPSGAGSAACVALAFPDRVAKRRDASGADWISAGGRGFRLDPASPLAREQWLAVAEVGGTAAGARILSAAAIDAGGGRSLFADRIDERHRRSPSIRPPAPSAPRTAAGSARSSCRAAGTAAPRRARSRRPCSKASARMASASCRGARRAAIAAPARRLRARLRSRASRPVRRRPCSPARRLAAGVLAGKRSLGDVDPGAAGALDALLGWEAAGRSTGSRRPISRRRRAAAMRSTMRPKPDRP